MILHSQTVPIFNFSWSVRNTKITNSNHLPIIIETRNRTAIKNGEILLKNILLNDVNSIFLRIAYNIPISKLTKLYHVTPKTERKTYNLIFKLKKINFKKLQSGISGNVPIQDVLSKMKNIKKLIHQIIPGVMIKMRNSLNILYYISSSRICTKPTSVSFGHITTNRPELHTLTMKKYLANPNPAPGSDRISNNIINKMDIGAKSRLPRYQNATKISPMSRNRGQLHLCVLRKKY